MDRDLEAKLRLFRTAASVTRVHTRRTIYRQSVGEHTFGVIALILLIEPKARIELVRAALVHDIPEAITGDMPSPTKDTAMSMAMYALECQIENRYQIRENITEDEARLLKYADIMELAMFSSEEADMGNSYGVVMMRRCLDALEARNLTSVTPQAAELFVMMRAQSNRFGHTHGVGGLNHTVEY